MSAEDGNGFSTSRKYIEYRLDELAREVAALRVTIGDDFRHASELRASQQVQIHEMRTKMTILGGAIVIVMGSLVGYIVKLLFE